jgi:hypothetical protein
VTRTLFALMGCALLGSAIGASGARADDDKPAVVAQPDLVKQANAPIATIFQVRLQDAYTPKFDGADGTSNGFTVALTMPLPAYRLIPLPQLSVLTIPAAVTPPTGPTGFGDLRFLDIAILDVGHAVLFGVGPTFVLPTASDRTTGQGKWQVGPAAVVAFAPEGWLVGVLAQNPISFAGSGSRRNADALFLQPFVTYQLGEGWFVRSQPQLTFDWKSHKEFLPLDLGFGRVFKLGEQNVSCFVEVTRNLSRDEPAPRYAITTGVSLLFPNMWR